MAAKRSSLWFGFLDAGAKGSLVVRDHSIDTGAPNTIYLFNYAKGRILEYRRDIAEPKLRELNDDEREKLKELRQAFKTARDGFTPRVILRPPRVAKPEPEPEPEIPDFEADDDIPAPVSDDDADGDELEMD
jgi:hypothetical protein